MTTTIPMYKMTFVCGLSESSPVEASLMSLSFIESDNPLFTGAVSIYRWFKSKMYRNRKEHQEQNGIEKNRVSRETGIA